MGKVSLSSPRTRRLSGAARGKPRESSQLSARVRHTNNFVLKRGDKEIVVAAKIKPEQNFLDR